MSLVQSWLMRPGRIRDGGQCSVSMQSVPTQGIRRGLAFASIPYAGSAGYPLSLERQMRELTVKTKFLYVLPEAFSLGVPYTDRQRIVVAADEQVAAERQVRSRLAVQGESRPLPAGSDDAGEPLAGRMPLSLPSICNWACRPAGRGRRPEAGVRRPGHGRAQAAPGHLDDRPGRGGGAAF